MPTETKSMVVVAGIEQFMLLLFSFPFPFHGKSCIAQSCNNTLVFIDYFVYLNPCHLDDWPKFYFLSIEKVQKAMVSCRKGTKCPLFVLHVIYQAISTTMELDRKH